MLSSGNSPNSMLSSNFWSQVTSPKSDVSSRQKSVNQPLEIQQPPNSNDSMQSLWEKIAALQAAEQETFDQVSIPPSMGSSDSFYHDYVQRMNNPHEKGSQQVTADPSPIKRSKRARFLTAMGLKRKPQQQTHVQAFSLSRSRRSAEKPSLRSRAWNYLRTFFTRNNTQQVALPSVAMNWDRFHVFDEKSLSLADTY
jgi:hypothetical protein